MATIVLGAQWGDEGKGKLTDILCSKVKLCARAAGGRNAGHSIVAANGVSYSFHLLPSGLVNPNCVNLIGSGVVFHVPSFFQELEELHEKGLDTKGRILVSDRCQVSFDLHAAVDGLEEVELGERKIGTTGKGIGPSYSSKAARNGVRVHEIFDEPTFERKLRLLAAGYKKRFGDLLEYDVEEEIARFKEYRNTLPSYVVDAVSFMKTAQDNNEKFAVEGANACLLDMNVLPSRNDYGTYPYVTSSNTGLGGVITGLALNPAKIDNIVGVVKAYTTRVGGGPFKTEDLGEAGTKLQEIGREWGVSTGRRRRCGWLDLVVLKYSTAINYYTLLNLTKLDVLDTFPIIKVAVAYKSPEGEEIDYFPADLGYLETCEVVYKEFEGWQKPTTHAKTYYDLPKQAREYIEFIENFVGVKIGWIGTGPSRDDMITRTA
ncbi:hypothetical protein ED733_005106 [Metarhizium rileyi]|uniref:Adenylosuccinate synthetase n=1 Tax=Metarhizium rileyi (strain RCEF 4871) TaxID=1649241 RepID=A0A5C6G872_METRR|nr:hypothetical protein ED733_005106 [Metarhizium rileyi]